MHNKRVVVTGGAGFLGSHVVQHLWEKHRCEATVPHIDHFDLRDSHAVRWMYEEYEPHIVINLAAAVGGLGANLANPGKFFHDNLIMGMHLIEQGRKHGLEKFVQMGSACEYPKNAVTPIVEECVWDGYPEGSNASYGVAKRALLEMGQAYRKQYGMDVIHLLSTNLYGPRDNFNLITSHVIPALIERCLTQRVVTVWGDGTATRDFLYVKDAARAIVQLTEGYTSDQPINLGSDREVSIRELTELVRTATEFKGVFQWDTSKPNGQPRRFLDTTRAKAFGVTAPTKLEDGLKETVSWYKSVRSH